MQELSCLMAIHGLPLSAKLFGIACQTRLTISPDSLTGAPIEQHKNESPYKVGVDEGKVADIGRKRQAQAHIALTIQRKLYYISTKSCHVETGTVLLTTTSRMVRFRHKALKEERNNVLLIPLFR